MLNSAILCRAVGDAAKLASQRLDRRASAIIAKALHEDCADKIIDDRSTLKSRNQGEIRAALDLPPSPPRLKQTQPGRRAARELQFKPSPFGSFHNMRQRFEIFGENIDHEDFLRRYKNMITEFFYAYNIMSNCRLCASSIIRENSGRPRTGQPSAGDPADIFPDNFVPAPWCTIPAGGSGG